MRDLDRAAIVRELEATNDRYLKIIRDRNRIVATLSGVTRCPHDLKWGECNDPTCALKP